MVSEAMSEQFVRLGWRVGDDPPQLIDSRWSDIIGCILKYQQEHGGKTPFVPVIAQHTGMSPGQVQFHLEQLKKRGFIIERGTWPLRLSVVASAVQAVKQEAAPAAPPEEEEVMATVTPPRPVREKRTGHKRRESFLVNAKRFAQVLTDYYDRHGHAPLIKDIAEELGYSAAKPVGVSRVVKEMVERGWLHHKAGHHGDFVLTGIGRAVLFGEPLREEVHTDMPVRPQSERRIEPDPHYPPTQMVSPVVQAYRPKPEPEPERPAMREYQPVAQTVANLSDIDSVDLVLELTARGFRVSR